MNTPNNTTIIELTQATIALAMVGATVANVALSRPLPTEFVNMVLLVVGFYFGRASNGKYPSAPPPATPP